MSSLHLTACQDSRLYGNIITFSGWFTRYPMTVRFRHRSAAGGRSAPTAKIIKLCTLRTSSLPKLSFIHSDDQLHETTTSRNVAPLSMRQRLTCKAAMGINDLGFIEQSYSLQVANNLMSSIRELLDKEFGRLRVHQQHGIFVVSHHCAESLIAGLLRVQFHGREISLPATREGAGLSDVCGVPVSWGVGKTFAEAEEDRLDRGKP